MARSSHVSVGRALVRRSTATSWRRMGISVKQLARGHTAVLDHLDAASSSTLAVPASPRCGLRRERRGLFDLVQVEFEPLVLALGGDEAALVGGSLHDDHFLTEG